jgi:hypothetical protein
MIGRLIAASLTATCKFALCLFPVFPSAALWTALLSPDFQGAKSDPFFVGGLVRSSQRQCCESSVLSEGHSRRVQECVFP